MRVGMNEAIKTVDRYMAKPTHEIPFRLLNAAMNFWFDKIKPDGHWKGPINAQIKADWFGYCAAACEFFTGTELAVENVFDDDFGTFFDVAAAGYYGGPCN